MGTYEELKAAIQQVIRTNGNNEITGALLQNALLSIVNVVGANATFAGIATPNTNPGTADQNVFYLATEAGTYVNFGGIEINMGEAVILSNKTGNWVKTTSGFATQQQLTELESYIGKSPVISASPQVKDFADTILEIYVRPKFELTDDIRKDRFYLSYWGGNGVAQGGMLKTDGNWVAAINVPKTTYKQDGLTLWYANNNNYEIAFLADEALYPNVTGFPQIEFRIPLTNSIHPAIRAILDKKELTEKIESFDNTTLTDGIVYSELKVADEPGNARVYSEYFKAGNVVSLKVLEATSGNANDGGISFYGFFADGTYETLWDAPAGGHLSKLIELSKDYDYINCYANPSIVQYHLTIGVVSSSYKKAEENASQINGLIL